MVTALAWLAGTSACSKVGAGVGSGPSMNWHPASKIVNPTISNQRNLFAVTAYYEKLGWPKHLGNCTGAARYFQRCGFFDVCHGHPADTVEELRDNPPFGYKDTSDD